MIYICTVFIIILLYNNIRKITPGYRIEFDKKVKKFRSRYAMLMFNVNLIIYIRRERIFFDAYDEIMNKTLSELKKRLRINYLGEYSTDAGGLLR